MIAVTHWNNDNSRKYPPLVMRFLLHSFSTFIQWYLVYGSHMRSYFSWIWDSKHIKKISMLEHYKSMH